MHVEFFPSIPSQPQYSEVFGEMFGGWLCQYEGLSILVDCGVGSGADNLVALLKERLAGRNLDYVLVTHIHLDHAGGLGAIFRAWPSCQAVVHARGIRHLIQPERLVASTHQVMGCWAGAYGVLEPLEPGRLIAHTDCNVPGVEVWETPGHAPHQIAFQFPEALFAGEALGAPFWYEGKLFSQPATPPIFSIEEARKTLDLLAKISERPTYCAHAPKPFPLSETIKLYQTQLTLWEDVLSQPQNFQQDGEADEAHLNRLLAELARYDVNLSHLNQLKGREHQRELIFLHNNLQGFRLCVQPPVDTKA